MRNESFVRDLLGFYEKIKCTAVANLAVTLRASPLTHGYLPVLRSCFLSTVLPPSLWLSHKNIVHAACIVYVPPSLPRRSTRHISL